MCHFFTQPDTAMSFHCRQYCSVAATDLCWSVTSLLVLSMIIDSGAVATMSQLLRLTWLFWVERGVRGRTWLDCVALPVLLHWQRDSCCLNFVHPAELLVNFVQADEGVANLGQVQQQVQVQEEVRGKQSSAYTENRVHLTIGRCCGRQRYKCKCLGGGSV